MSAVFSFMPTAGTKLGAGLATDVGYFASIQNLMGVVKARQGEIDQARVLQESSLEQLEKTFGPDHHFLTWPLKDLGELYGESGDYEVARKHLERALEIRRRSRYR